MSRMTTKADGSAVECFSAAETASLVRAALKRSFPGTKFSVRSKTYSGGASVTVSYTDGPTSDRVRKVAERYSGAGFDGMIDLKYHHEHFLCPDGTVVWARSYGHSYDNAESVRKLDDMPPGAKRVSFGADFVFVNRDFSAEREAELLAELADAAGIERFERNGEYDVAIIEGRAVPCGGVGYPERWGTDLYWKLASARDYTEEVG